MAPEHPVLFTRLLSAFSSKSYSSQESGHRRGSSRPSPDEGAEASGAEFGCTLPFASIGSAQYALDVLGAQEGHAQSGSLELPSSSSHLTKQLLDACQSYLSHCYSQNSGSLWRDSSDSCGEIASNLVELCRKCSNPEQLQTELFDLLGESGWELMSFVLTNWNDMQSIPLPLGKSDSELTNPTELDFPWPTSAAGGDFSNAQPDWLQRLGFSEEYLREERSLGLQKNSTFESWRQGLAPSGTVEVNFPRSSLPANAVKTLGQGFEEVHIPAAKKPPAPAPNELVDVRELPQHVQAAFPDTTHLNRIQSRVFPCAFRSNENMLVCAPTGAGKTNIAMLSLLRLLDQVGSEGMRSAKAIYIAPMKALAQEVVQKFSERLAPLKLVVREYTGDVQLSKQEVMDSHLLVCTPEKYDSATRKGGDGSLGTLVSLIIIDEVHLLADERGAVIETIVARTQRLVESSQRVVRIVGLSATLPNYADVASFLRVNPSSGLFFFGPEYRPIPLDQTFLGLTDKQRNKRADLMNFKAYEKTIAALEAGKQVMIFVHARRETSKTLESLLDLCTKYGTYHLLENVQHEKFTLFKRQVDKSRSTEVQQLFYRGVGVHHAGMLRSDRTLVEQLFECGLLKVLCCTATLAWGVNLPAHTVIIKGTEMYDPERGGFVDVSVLDILQIFGRAGRPQYDVSGHAILITQQKSMNMYLGLIAQQTPIESALIKSLVDHLNAEIVNGTVTNIKEAIVWLSYTFLFVRMKRNPLAYGLKLEDLFDDPQLDKKRQQLVTEAAETLDRCMMARYDKRSGNLAVTDLGRIASHYYIKHSTIESFNSLLSPHMLRPDALHLLCSSSEFDQLKVRPDELAELDQLKKGTSVPIKGDETACKVNTLLQSFLNQSKINSFTLQSDLNYVAQNGSRIARALFEVCLKKGWSSLAKYYHTLCKCIDRRMSFYHSPLRQFLSDPSTASIPKEVFKRLEDNDVDHQMLLDMTEAEIGQLVHNHKIGSRIKQLAKQLPALQVEVAIQPITKGIVRIKLQFSASFVWMDRFHGFAEPFWIWIEDGESEYIYHAEHVVIQRSARHESKALEITIPVRDPLPAQYFVRVVSDMWVGCETVVPISFRGISMPQLERGLHSALNNLHPIPKSALRDERFEALYPFSHFNPVQSQAFHTLYHTDRSTLVGAPTGSGKTIFAELAILRQLKTAPRLKTVYVAPLKALAKERLLDWQRKLGTSLNLSVLELTGDVTPNPQILQRADILIVTPEKWDSISRGWRKRSYVSQIGLMIIDEIHLLGVDRGPVLEVLVSRMRFISSQTGQAIRFLGLSTALANARDLGDWLGIPPGTVHGAPGLYNFRPSVRPVPMTIHIQGFPGKHYCPRMATMNKPAYAAIIEHSPTKPVLIFVSSRRQTRLTALDLIAHCAADDNPKRFLGLPEDEVTAISSTVSDPALKDCLVFGIGVHHAGLSHYDRNLVEELFLTNKIQVLVCTSTLAWGVNLPCHLVIVKGTEYFDAVSHTYVDFPVTDVLQMIGRAGRPQFDTSAVACIFVHEPKKQFYRKFLHEPFPVESSLHLQLHEHINAEIANETIFSLEDAVEYLTWTYLYRRLLINPTYYGAVDAQPASIRAYLLQLAQSVLDDLAAAQCISLSSTSKYSEFSASKFGFVASYYYLHYRTPAQFCERFQALQSNPRITDERWLFWRVLQIMCDAQEFAKIPVRHNEDQLNADLAGEMEVDREDLVLGDMLSPHVKTFLLVTAYIRRVRMPISDYNNDLKSVLDQIPRVLNAMVDIAAEEGYATLVASLALVSQAVKQIVDPTVDNADVRQLPNLYDGSACVAAVNSLRARNRSPTLEGLRSLPLREVESVLSSLSKPTWSQLQVQETLQAIFCSVPKVNLRYESSVLSWGDETATPSQGQSPGGMLRSGIRYKLVAQFELATPNLGAFRESGKRRDESAVWWIFVTAPSADAEVVVALQRVTRLQSSRPITLTFILPADCASESVRLNLLNDSVLGVQYRFSFAGLPGCQLTSNNSA